MEVSGGEVAEQVIRPTGFGSRCGGGPRRGRGRSAGGDPRSGGQESAGAGHRMTKRMAEDLTDYLAENEAGALPALEIH